MYYPTAPEIQAMITRGITKNTGLATRFQAAEKILLASHLYWHEGAWRADSSKNPDQSYTVSATTCTCPAAIHKPDMPCKHRLALLTFRQLLADHLNARITGDSRFSGDRKRASLAPNERILTDTIGKTPLACTYIHGHRFARPICRIRKDLRQNRWVFQSETDVKLFADWLGDAHPLRSTEPDFHEADAAAEALAIYTAARARGLSMTEAAEIADCALVHA